MAPRYIRPPARHQVEKLELLTCIHLLIENRQLLMRLKAQIVRRGADPDGWAARFEDLLLEDGCALDILAGQVDAFWPEPPEREA